MYSGKEKESKLKWEFEISEYSREKNRLESFHFLVHPNKFISAKNHKKLVFTSAQELYFLLPRSFQTSVHLSKYHPVGLTEKANIYALL